MSIGVDVVNSIQIRIHMYIEKKKKNTGQNGLYIDILQTDKDRGKLYILAVRYTNYTRAGTVELSILRFLLKNEIFFPQNFSGFKKFFRNR